VVKGYFRQKANLMIWASASYCTRVARNDRCG
jgi:hypothetical protein